MSTLFVNNLNTASGSTITIPTGKTLKSTDTPIVGAGNVIQVLSTPMNASKSTQSTSFVGTGHSVTITPKYNNSKMYLNLSGGAWHISSAQSFATFYRGSTNLGDASVGLCQNEQAYTPHSFSFLDSPATTNATTYEVYWRVTHATHTSYYSYSSYGTVVLTVMEIAQ